MAKSADAADLKSADPQGLWGFKSPSGHHKINNLHYKHSDAIIETHSSRNQFGNHLFP